MSLALSEAIKGYGTDDPHTAEARQKLADHYGVMHNYDLAVPRYVEVSAVLRSASSQAVVCYQTDSVCAGGDQLGLNPRYIFGLR